MIAANPFGHPGRAVALDPTTLHVTFARDPLDALELDPAGFAPEEWALVGRELYLHLPNGMGRSRLAEALDKDASACRKGGHHPELANGPRTVAAMLD